MVAFKVLELVELIVDQIIFFLVVEVVVILPMVEPVVAVKREEVHLLEVHKLEAQELLTLEAVVVEVVDLLVTVPKQVEMAVQV